LQLGSGGQPCKAARFDSGHTLYPLRRMNRSDVPHARRRRQHRVVSVSPGDAWSRLRSVCGLPLAPRSAQSYAGWRMNEVTRILNALAQGDAKAAGQLLPLVYDELRRLAAQKLAREPAGQTLDATALVHEAYLRLVQPARDGTLQGDEPHWQNHGHFFAS